jgi:hypothetical protein
MKSKMPWSAISVALVSAASLLGAAGVVWQSGRHPTCCGGDMLTGWSRDQVMAERVGLGLGVEVALLAASVLFLLAGAWMAQRKAERASNGDGA